MNKIALKLLTWKVNKKDLHQPCKFSTRHPLLTVEKSKSSVVLKVLGQMALLERPCSSLRLLAPSISVQEHLAGGLGLLRGHSKSGESTKGHPLGARLSPGSNPTPPLWLFGEPEWAKRARFLHWSNHPHHDGCFQVWHTLRVVRLYTPKCSFLKHSPSSH